MKRNNIAIIILILLVFAPLTEILSETLEEYLMIAAENNPELKAKFLEYNASLQKIDQVGALPDPELSFGFVIMTGEPYFHEKVAEISIMQMFPWFGSLGAAKNEAALMAKAKYEQFNEAKSNLFMKIKKSWYELYLIEKEMEFVEENKKILKNIEQISLDRFKTGTTGKIDSFPEFSASTGRTESNPGTNDGMNMGGGAAPGISEMSMPQMTQNSMDSMSTGGSGMIDILRIKIEMNELESRMLFLRDKKQSLISEFNSLLNRPPDEEITINAKLKPAELAESFEKMNETVKQDNFMLKMVEKEMDATLAMEKMNKKMGLPMIGLGLQYDTVMSKPDMFMPMITLSIPLWRSKYNAFVKESQIMLQSLSHQKISISNALSVMLKVSENNYNDAVRRLNLYREQTILAKQSLDLLIINYSVAGGKFEEVLSMQRKLLEYRLKEITAIVDSNIAVAEIHQLMGKIELKE